MTFFHEHLIQVYVHIIIKQYYYKACWNLSLAGNNLEISFWHQLFSQGSRWCPLLVVWLGMLLSSGVWECSYSPWVTLCTYPFVWWPNTCLSYHLRAGAASLVFWEFSNPVAALKGRSENRPRRMQGVVLNLWSVLKRKMGASSFGPSVIGQGVKVLNWTRVNLDQMQRKNVLLLVVKHWHGLPREDLDALSLETFRAWLDGTLSNLF